ncbi:low-density lipoprotein receptor-like isoform X6 [Drosophila innubila]|uniref:low-density lipoprotein receptor-like isoform X6 n=1 Tax=Drosophila innubila TaxID=198719 RepID=UPI00148E0968|nr:low-density lipoprotein receptor-like isoform X6 [Drosophila innubila]
MAIELRSTTTVSDSTTATTTTTITTTPTINTTTNATTGCDSNSNSNNNCQRRAQQLFSCVCANANLVLLTLMLTLSKCCTATPTATPLTTTNNEQMLPAGGVTLTKLLDGKGILNMGFKFLNVSGKIGTPLDIAQALYPKCDEKQFQCQNGDCIPIRFVCDGDADCKDHSDEQQEQCRFPESTCGSDQFRCNNGNCIPNKWRCDRESDCADGSDESPGLCKSKACSSDEFACKSGDGECIPLNWMCDQSKDCRDGSDEASCNTTCRSDEFTCGNERCIQKRWVCDHDDDCGDGSDERNCPKIECPRDSFTCANGACIMKKWVCDSDPDCPDGSDEQGCQTPNNMTACTRQEFQCKDRITCVHQSWLCDGDRDCPDGDDEDSTNCRSVTCRPDQFQCGDRSCIAGHLTCNGESDCADGSDERDCRLSAQSKSCNSTSQFDCGGGQCIPLSKVCDKHKDCPDGEDEPAGKCEVNECASKNGNCMHRCVDHLVGYVCECHEGYKLSSDGHTCVDINECEEPGVCSQLCVNEIGGFKCECEAGYMRDPRNHTRCKATEGHASLLLARRHDIRKIALDHMEMTSIVNSTKSATALDFVFRTGMIFWSDVTTQSIYKAPIDEGNDKTVVLKQSSVTSDGLAVDWIYNHVYYTDTHKCTIELTNFDGNMGKVLIEDALDIPRSIALDPIDGWMYWSDWGASPRIERAGMDGSHRTTIINYDIKWPNGITLDLVLKRIYWVDGKLNVISSANYDGSQRRQILYSTEYLRHPFSISTFEDYIYWSDWEKQTVFKANKFTGEGVEPITAVHMLQHPMVVHVYHPYRQPDGVNHCQSVNGHCSHLCLPAPRINERSPRISCACPTGLKLMADGLMCVEDHNTESTRPVKNKLKTTTTITPTKTTTASTYVKLPEDAPSAVPADKGSAANATHKDDSSSEPAKTQEQKSGLITVVVIVVPIVAILVLAGACYVFIKRYPKRGNSMNFVNPTYNKTTEDTFSLEKNAPINANSKYAPALDEEVSGSMVTSAANPNDFSYVRF